VDFERRQLTIREGKGNRDRAALLPRRLEPALHQQLERSWEIFAADRRAKTPGVQLPNALARKFPRAAVDWRWHWLFPAPENNNPGDVRYLWFAGILLFQREKGHIPQRKHSEDRKSAKDRADVGCCQQVVPAPKGDEAEGENCQKQCLGLDQHAHDFGSRVEQVVNAKPQFQWKREFPEVAFLVP